MKFGNKYEKVDTFCLNLFSHFLKKLIFNLNEESTFDLKLNDQGQSKDECKYFPKIIEILFNL